MKELLVPVGNYECLVAAINAGADAVYLGGKKFGARAFADNFDNETLIKSINLCHLYGVKIYVTVNTLIHESEMDEVMEYIKFLHKNNVDAVIVQDIGLINLIRNTLPNLEVHASTQVHTTNEETIKVLESLGVKRIIMAREVSVDKINLMNTNLEIETFIHGALCVSYSGECLFSSRLMNRSGNRGECAQICRLPFKLISESEEIKTDGNYLLSTKELNTSEYFKKILDSNIYSLKIEGRMKGVEYVACVTKLYRDLLDKYYNHEELVVNEEYLNDLKKIFNREYTKGFILNESNKDIMNIKTSNHQGVKIGEVIGVDKKYITIKLDDYINQGDGIRFSNSNDGMMVNFLYDEKDLLINGKENGIVKVQNKCDTNIGDIVNKTFDIKVSEKYKNLSKKLIDIKMHFSLKCGEPAKLEVNDGKNHVSVTGVMSEKSITSPMTESSIIKQLSKLGNSIYSLDTIDIDLDDGLFIRVSDLNDIRRNALLELDNKRIGSSNYIYQEYHKTATNKLTNSINILVRNEEQLQFLLDKDVSIIVDDINLFEKYSNHNNIYYRESRIGENLKENRNYATELGGIKYSVAGDYYLNVTNHYTLDYLSNYLDRITLSVELSDKEIENIMNYHKYNVELFIYGKIELMLMKYCPLNLLVSKTNMCSVCKNKDKYYLVDRNGSNYRILNDIKSHTTHILDSKIINKLDNIDYYRSIGINNFKIELLDEDINEIKDILRQVGVEYE